jgi:thiosulfate/3-mercaptopyruvate sulfurtransferase
MLLISRKKAAVIALFLIVVALMGCKNQKEEKTPRVSAEITPGIMVSSEELADLARQRSVVIIDARGADEYRKLHIPDAVNIPSDSFRDPDTLKEILEYKKNNGFAIPTEMAERIFSEAGVDTKTRIIIYDSITFPHSSIIWAILKYFGHDNAQVLKGGFEKWIIESRAITKKSPEVQKKTFVARPRPEMVATREWVLNNKGNTVVWDLRSFEEYLGINPAGNPRGGHIPGAINLEWRHLAGHSTVKSTNEIQEILEEAGVTRDKEIVTLCNIGIGRSTYGLMVLKMLGYDNVRVYGGSFEDWSNADELAVATTEIGSFKDWITTSMNSPE